MRRLLLTYLALPTFHFIKIDPIPLFRTARGWDLRMMCFPMYAFPYTRTCIWLMLIYGSAFICPTTIQHSICSIPCPSGYLFQLCFKDELNDKILWICRTTEFNYSTHQNVWCFDGYWINNTCCRKHRRIIYTAYTHQTFFPVYAKYHSL